MSKNTKNEKLLTAVECEDLFTGFKSERERLKYISRAYKNINIAKAFSIYYDLDLDNSINNILSTHDFVYSFISILLLLFHISC